MMVMRTDPFEQMDRIFNAFGTNRGGVMPMDAFEKDGTYTLRFDLPGIEPESVDVTVESGRLTVSASRPGEDTEGANWLVRERPAGQYSREIRLGQSLDVSQVDATYDQGVLTVRIPMRAEAKPHRVAVTGPSRTAIESN
jgi:HSP20 family protein